MSAPLSPEALEALRRLDACTLANAVETFRGRLRNEGFMDGTVHCLFPHLQPMVGYAATLSIRGSDPPIGDRAYPQRTDWWDYVLAVPAPRILVVQDTATRIGFGSLIGAVHMNILQKLQCVGVVTNGSVRDIPAADREGFHYFAGGVSVSHAYVHVVQVGIPVKIGGLSIQSGDLLHGDVHGVQSVPLAIAAAVPAAAEQICAGEREIIALCRSPEFTLDKLRALLARQQS